jgi:hypothetical protein
MTRTNRFAAAALFAFALSSSAPARAQNAATAQALFDEGLKLKDAKNYAAACPKLASSQKLDPGAGTALQLADCYEKNGQTASAWATYIEAVSLARSGGHPDWADRAKSSAAALEPKLSRLTIIVPPAADVPGLEIERDGVKVDRSAWGSAIPVDPGAHPIVATAPTKQQWSTTVAVGPNAARVDVTIPALQVEQNNGAPGPVLTQPSPGGNDGKQLVIVDNSGANTADGSTQRTIGLVVAGVGAVGLGLGGVFGLLAKSTYDDARSHCGADNRCSADGVSGVDKANSQATLSTVAMSVGAVALAGGLVLYFIAPSGKSTSTVGLNVAPTRGGAALGLGGAW